MRSAAPHVRARLGLSTPASRCSSSGARALLNVGTPPRHAPRRAGSKKKKKDKKGKADLGSAFAALGIDDDDGGDGEVRVRTPATRSARGCLLGARAQ